MGSKILIIDDDPEIVEILGFNLNSEGYQVMTASSAEEGLDLLNETVDLILLDVMMAGMSGYKMAQQLRTAGNKVPIIFLTAKDGENDMLTGFSVGADDYLSKPFSIKELMARMKAVLKRSGNNSGQSKKGTVFTANPLAINFEAKTVTVEGKMLFLTKTEYGILALLAQNPLRVFSRDEIISRIWGEAVLVSERTVDVHIARLRKKMGAAGSLICNRQGFGYQFESSSL